MKTKLLTICLLLFTSQVFAKDLTGEKLYCPYEEKNEILNNHIRTFIFISDNQLIQSFYDLEGKAKSMKSNYSVKFNSIEIDGVLEPIVRTKSESRIDELLDEVVGGNITNNISISRDRLFLVSKRTKALNCKLYSHMSKDNFENKAKKHIEKWVKKLDRKL